MKNKNIFIVLLLFWSLAPLVWQLYTSFCSSEAITNPLSNSLNRWTLKNYRDLFTIDPPFWRYMLNSLIVGFTSTILTIIIAIPASYILTKLRKNISNILYIILFICALFPYVLLFLALLEIAREFDIANNLVALSIPYSALSMPLAILLLTSAFDGLPSELEDAARIEGLGLFQRLRFILIPLIMPAISSTSILVFLFSWNEYPIALTWISESKLQTLPVAIARIAGSSIYSVPYGAYAAATVIGAIPVLVIVMFFQKQIVSGLTKGALKG